MSNSSYEQQKADLKRKIADLPKWQQDMYFAKLRQLGLVSITEEELKTKPKLYIIKGEK